MTTINTAIEFSNDLARSIDTFCVENGITPERALLIFDSALEPTPAVQDILPTFPIVHAFDATRSEPTTDEVDTVVRRLRTLPERIQLVVTIGGGATMDLGKAVAIIYENEGDSASYQGWGRSIRPGVPCICIPSLFGTSAELTPIAVLRGPELKLGINSPFVAPKRAIINVALSATSTIAQRWFTMVDSLLHAVEIERSHTSTVAAKEFASACAKITRSVLSSDGVGLSVDDRERSATASILGGLATLGGRVGACHALSYGVSAVSPSVRHSWANVLVLLGLRDFYGDIVDEVIDSADQHGIALPKFSTFEIEPRHIPRMTEVAVSLDPLWKSHFGLDYDQRELPPLVSRLYHRLFNMEVIA